MPTKSTSTKPKTPRTSKPKAAPKKITPSTPPALGSVSGVAVMVGTTPVVVAKAKPKSSWSTTETDGRLLVQREGAVDVTFDVTAEGEPFLYLEWPNGANRKIALGK